MKKIITLLLYILAGVFGLSAQVPTPSAINIPSPTPNPAPLASDTYTRAINSISLEATTTAAFKYGNVTAGATHLLNLNLSNYPAYVGNGYCDTLPTANTPIMDPSRVLGTVEGKKEIAPNGAFSYNLPVECSPGTAGMQPNLSVGYNSYGKNGLLGMGFDLQGVSVISRTNKTAFYDGNNGGINFTTSDVFALDGDRLLIAGGIYGASGATYKSEVENYSTLTSMGAIGSGPQYFTLVTPNGNTIEYGNASTARLVAAGGTEVLSWYINKITDPFGNYMTYSYTYNDGEVLLDHIDYTINTAMGLSAYNKVSFNYVDRADSTTLFVSGKAFRRTKLLKYISCTDQNNNLFRRYAFDYQYGYASLLHSITMGDVAGNQLNPTYFDWSKSGIFKGSAGPFFPPNAIAPSITILGGTQNAILGIGADMNGDGKKDLVVLAYGTQTSSPIAFDVYRTIPSGYPAPSYRTDFVDENLTAGLIPNSTLATPVASFQIVDSYAFDEDDDGREEVFINFYCSNTSSYFIKKIKYTGGNYVVSTEYSGTVPALSFIVTWHARGSDPRIKIPTFTHSGYQYAKEDFTGDNVRDQLIVDQNGVKLVTTSPASNTYITSYSQDNIIKAQLGDYNGDGVQDLFLLTVTDLCVPGGNVNFSNIRLDVYSFQGGTFSSIAHRNISTGISSAINNCSLTTRVAFYESVSNHISFGDFNGDGRTDIIYNQFPSGYTNGVNPGTANVYVSLSNAAGGTTGFTTDRLVYSGIPTTINGFDAGFFASDINNDGQVDWGASAFNSTNQTSYYTHYASTGGVLASSTYTFSQINAFAGSLLDLDGDGALDFVSQLAFGTGVGLVYNIFNHYNKRMINHVYNIKDDYQIDYGLLSERKATNGNYLYQRTTSGNPATFSVTYVPLFVVATTTANNVVNNYAYENMLFHRLGKGLLGFENFYVNSLSTNLLSKTSFTYDGTKDFVTNTQKINGIATGGSVFVALSNPGSAKVIGTYNYVTTGTNRYLSTSTVKNLDYLTSLYSDQVTTFDNTKAGKISGKVATFYNWGGSSPIRSETQSYAYSLVANAFNGISYYKPTSTNITKTAGTSSNLQTTYTYNGQGNLTSKVDYANTSLPVTTTYNSFDYFGNALSVTISAPDVPLPRTAQYVYDNTGRFVIRTTDALGNTESAIYDPGYGIKLQTTDIAWLTTKYTYDGMGRITSAQTPNAAINTASYQWNYYADPITFISYYGGKINTQMEGGGLSSSYYDRNDNLIRTESAGFGGNLEFSDYQYNNIGQVTKQTEPHYSSQPAFKTTTYLYDQYLRTTQVKESIGSTNVAANYTYNGPCTSDAIAGYVAAFTKLTTPTSNSGQTSTVEKDYNSAGQITMIKNFSSIGSINTAYSYNQLNKPVSALSTFAGAGGGNVTFSYDALGRPMTTSDPSSGTIIYTYNSIGELVERTTAPGNTYDYTYDQLGRMTTKTSYNSMNYTYQYVTGGNGIGLLQKVTGPNATTEFTYDNLGRTTEKKETILSNNKILKTDYDYNKYGQLVNYTYPSGFVTTNEYDNIGTLLRIKNSNTVIWELNSMYSPGRFGQFTYNNGLINNSYGYDVNNNLAQINYGTYSQQSYTVAPTNGDLIWRKFINQAVSNNEQFTYDNFDRLTITSFLNSSNVLTQTASVSYYNNGNINVKSDAGVYTYTTPPGSYYQLTQVSGGLNNWNPNTLGITYTDFNKVSQITEAGSPTQEMDFVYGNNEERIMMQYKVAGSLSYTRYYTDNYDRQENSSTYTEWNYIYAPTGLCAVYFDNNGSAQINYVLTDHLGSPVMTINGQNLAVLEQYSFDAWGRRRNPANWNNYTLSSMPTYMIRGFTGHEHLDEFGIINMNGRLYDPILGRFLQPDKYVEGTDNVQSYNRYVYCHNNPLKYTDPSGNWDGWDDLIVSAVGFLVGYFSYAIETGDWGGKALLAGLIGAAVAEVSYLTLGGGLSAAATAPNVLASSEVMDNAIMFGAEYGITDAGTLYTHADQIKAADKQGGLNGVWLSGIYDVAAGVQTGFGTTEGEGTVSGKLDELVNVEKEGALGGVASNALGTSLSNAITYVGESAYDSKTNSWSLKKVDVTELGSKMWKGAISGAAEQAIDNKFDALAGPDESLRDRNLKVLSEIRDKFALAIPKAIIGTLANKAIENILESEDINNGMNSAGTHLEMTEDFGKSMLEYGLKNY